MLSIFRFQSNEVRVKLIDNEPWFVAKDICLILEHSDVSMACKRLKDYEKGTNTICTSGGNQDLLCISESGLYRLIMTSRKPQAEPFQDWVCQEVLPAIRKTGKFEVKQTIPYDAPSPALICARECREVIDLLEIDNPRLAQLLIDSSVNHHIGSQPQLSGSTPELRGVVEIAEDMGFRPNLSNRSTLGRFVVAQGFEPQKEKRLVNGTLREINCYEDSDPIRNAIKTFFEK